MTFDDLQNALECTPVIAAVPDTLWAAAVASPAAVLFHLNANVLTVGEHIRLAHEQQKCVFVHLDLAEGIARDKSGIAYLAAMGADGIISTRGQLIRLAKEAGLLTVQRVFALDSKGIGVTGELLDNVRPDMVEIMPGLIGKIIRRFAVGDIPVIAGGLIETKAEVTDALGNGALAVSTGKKELWYL